MIVPVVEGCAGGVRDTEGKPPLGLIPGQWLMGLGRVLGYGAAKYGAFNWRKGIPVSKHTHAALRHIAAFVDGEDLDQESGEPHLMHAAVDLLMAAWTLHFYGDRFDDRFRGAP